MKGIIPRVNFHGHPFSVNMKQTFYAACGSGRCESGLIVDWIRWPAPPSFPPPVPHYCFAASYAWLNAPLFSAPHPSVGRPGGHIAVCLPVCMPSRPFVCLCLSLSFFRPISFFSYLSFSHFFLLLPLPSTPRPCPLSPSSASFALIQPSWLTGRKKTITYSFFLLFFSSFLFSFPFSSFLPRFFLPDLSLSLLC